MRGKAKKVYPKDSEIRITPAYAGKSMYQILFDLNTKDHPRLCGEKSACHGWQKVALGSPPPMRGKGILSDLPRIVNRITPAYAGKSGRNQ